MQSSWEDSVAHVKAKGIIQKQRHTETVQSSESCDKCRFELITRAEKMHTDPRHISIRERPNLVRANKIRRVNN